MRIKGIVAYDGTGYGGFQLQQNALSIQAELERAIGHLAGSETRVLAAGRTDAGVHALGQVIAFDLDWRHPLEALLRGMNALLPEQIAVLELAETGESFHPRYDARRRHYRYTIYCSPVRSPFASRTSLHIGRSVDREAMQQAAAYVVGVHDFAAFGSPPVGDNSIREVFAASWSWQDPWLFFDIEANAFLYRMVRMLVGTMLRVGYGSLSLEQFRRILDTQDRREAGPAIAAKGLCLHSVTY